VTFVLLVGNVVRVGAWLWESLERGGNGLLAKEWRESEIVKAVQNLPPSYAISSNDSDVVLLYTGRNTPEVPEHFSRNVGRTPQSEQSYRRDMAELRKTLAEHGGFVVYFDNIPWRFYLPPESELVRDLNLELVTNVSGGRIYRSRAWDPAHRS